MKKIYVFLAILFFSFLAFADGTKQLMPNQGTETNPQPKGICYLALGNNQCRQFGRYHDTQRANDGYRIYIRINDCANEEIHFGFSDVLLTSSSTSTNIPRSLSELYRYLPNNHNLTYRIVDPGGTVVETKTLNSANITSYAQAYYGPNTARTDGKGYMPIIFRPTTNGSYWIEFDTGADFNAEFPQIDFKWFDISVVNTAERKTINGRLYGKTWGLTTTSYTAEAWSSFYTRSNDNYTSKVYLAGVQPYRFVFGCNSFGSIKTSTVEENRQSYVGANTFTPEYLVFLSKPHDDDWGGEAQVPNVPEQLTFAGDAITCEDLIFVVKLLHTEDALIELSMDLDPEENNGIDKIIVDSLKANVIKDRGYHYPWKNQTNITDAGAYWYFPSTPGCTRTYKLSLFDQRFRIDKTTANDYNIGDKIPQSVINQLEGQSLHPNDIKWSEDLGTENNPILINSQKELEDLRDAVNSGGNYVYEIKDFYIVGNDTLPFSFTINNNQSSGDGFKGVNFYLTAPTDSIVLGENWEPIGTIGNPFRGTFRCGRYNPDPTEDNKNAEYAAHSGDQDTITLTGTKSLFGVCENATIENIHIKYGLGAMIISDSDFLAYSEDISCFSPLCCYAKDTRFSHCTNAIQISNSDASGFTGGIIGYGIGCTLDSCYNFKNITASSSAAGTGGIAGRLANSTVSFCFNRGNITSEDCAGGIVGSIEGSSASTIAKCRNEGAVSCTGEEEDISAGGMLGTAFANFVVTDCYNTGTISAPTSGSMVGYEDDEIPVSGRISFCHNSGNISSGFDAFGPKCLEVVKSLAESTSETVYRNADNGVCTTTTEDIEPDTEHFFYNEDGTFSLFETECCGKIWRNEDAGRLYQNDSTFYITWDGKDDNGECVTGSINVDYQKNSGVTHFPFYDPEKMSLSNNQKGLVVYRISPIQDSIKNYGEGAKEKYGYQQLPKGFYRTDELEEDEYGIELNLFWDDRKVSLAGACTTPGTNPIVYGNTVTKEGETIETTKKTKYCYMDEVAGRCRRAEFYQGQLFCATYSKCNRYYYETTSTTAPSTISCNGIENVSYGGYLGSTNGGHTFPIDNFGNNNTINTWWNGVEVHGQSVLILKENEPAILLPITISTWDVSNLEHSVMLNWTTASEENNNYFSIERSKDGRKWTALGKVYGAGTSSMAHEYSFEDENPHSGISYYRLKQTDYNGEYTYSSIKCVNRPVAKSNSFKVYASKNTDEFIVEGEEIAACQIAVINVSGHSMSQISYRTISPSKVAISVNNLNIGTYFIKACDNAKSVVKNW